MGFATANESCTPPGESELIWATADQGKRIANLDETKITLDNTSPGQGGRPAMGLFNDRLAKAPTKGSHKSSYTATMVGGTFASGEKFPEHFQLPTDAKSKDNEGIYLEFLEDMLSTRAMYLGKEHKLWSATHNVNEKGGMNKDDFAAYIMRNFVPLVADDAADIPGKRVVLLVDGGPGRTNKQLLMDLKSRGIYLYPCGPPNTTHILQVRSEARKYDWRG